MEKKNQEEQEKKSNIKEENSTNTQNQNADEKIEANKKVETLRIQLEETEDRLKRVAAEFDNYKKRSSKEKTELYNSIMADIVSNFLPVIDNLEKAVEVETKDEEYKKGIELVLKQFQDVLANNGVQAIEALGQTFDPEFHEAVSSVQDDTKGEKEIVQEYRKGYRIGNKVIRHSMVIVAN